jgi:hypothetical protein
MTIRPLTKRGSRVMTKKYEVGCMKDFSSWYWCIERVSHNSKFVGYELQCSKEFFTPLQGQYFCVLVFPLLWADSLDAEDFTASIASDLDRTGSHGKRRTIPNTLLRSVPCLPEDKTARWNFSRKPQKRAVCTLQYSQVTGIYRSRVTAAVFLWML